MLVLAAAVVLVAGGCTQRDTRQTKKEEKVAEKTKHDSWWCDEHGIPEAECSMCSKKVADACKAKGDWCDKHDRALSQCFLCNPKLKDKFAAEYRAQYGEDPPPTEDDAR